MELAMSLLAPPKTGQQPDTAPRHTQSNRPQGLLGSSPAQPPLQFSCSSPISLQPSLGGPGALCWVQDCPQPVPHGRACIYLPPRCLLAPSSSSG